MMTASASQSDVYTMSAWGSPATDTATMAMVGTLMAGTTAIATSNKGRGLMILGLVAAI